MSIKLKGLFTSFFTQIARSNERFVIYKAVNFEPFRAEVRRCAGDRNLDKKCEGLVMFSGKVFRMFFFYQTGCDIIIACIN